MFKGRGTAGALLVTAGQEMSKERKILGPLMHDHNKVQ